jgi:multidrug efflux pump subunit AcrA (membrane-fusion protein)
MSAAAAPKKRRKWVKWVVIAAAVVVVGWVALSLFSGGQQTTGYTTATVQRQALQATVSGSGNAVVSDVTEVQPGITGTVTDLSVKLGQTVKAGQLLFRITNPDLDAAVQRAQAGYDQSLQQEEQAQAGVLQAENNLYSLQHPKATTVGTHTVTTAVDQRAVTLAKEQVHVAELGQTSANANLDSASTALSQAKDNAAKRTVTAPVGGVVTVLNAQNGQALTGNSSSSSSGSSAASASGSSNSAVEISDLSTLRAQVQINEVDLVNVKVGQEATVTFDALSDVTESGKVSAIAPTGTNSSGVITYNVNITLKSVDPRLRPTMSCTADIVTETKASTLVVPSAAVHTDSTTQQKYVEVLSSNGQVVQVAVKTGIVVGTQTEIVSGLTEGQAVVTGTTTSGSSTSSTTASSTAGARRGGIGAIFGGGR